MQGARARASLKRLRTRAAPRPEDTGDGEAGRSGARTLLSGKPQQADPAARVPAHSRLDPPDHGSPERQHPVPSTPTTP